MARIAFLLAGQGAQKPGMGKSLYEHSPAARALMDRLEAMRPGTLEMCFSGTAETLSRTENTQPCVFAVDMACAAAAMEAGLQPDFVAGFSLGELAGVALSGMLSLEETFALVLKRAQVMDACASAHPGAMLAVLKLDNERVEALAKEFQAVYPVNYNSPGQIVVACAADEADAFSRRVQEEGGRAMRLKVSGGFHSPFMADARKALEEALQPIALSPLAVPLYSNLTAQPYDMENAKQLLSGQVANPVRWQQTIENLCAAGADVFIEFGPGSTLTGLGKRIAPDKLFVNVEDAAGLQAALETIRREVC